MKKKKERKGWNMYDVPTFLRDKFKVLCAKKKIPQYKLVVIFMQFALDRKNKKEVDSIIKKYGVKP